MNLQPPAVPPPRTTPSSADAQAGDAGVQEQVVLCRFNNDGLVAAEEALNRLRRGSGVNLDEIVHSDDYVVPLGAPLAAPTFRTRFELGRYLITLLDGIADDLTDIDADRSLWNWIAFAWMPHLIDVTRPEQIGSPGRWLLDLDGWRSFRRHLFAVPWSILNRHRTDPDITRVLLAGAITQPGSAYDVASAQQKLVRSPGIIAAMTTLYVNDDGTIKRGAASRTEIAGTISRLQSYLNQLEKTYDIQTIRTEDLLATLPAEFDRFRDDAATSGSRIESRRIVKPIR